MPVQVSEAFLSMIFDAVKANNEALIEVDLENQKITICASGASESFEINGYKKSCMTNGYDDIDYLISQKSQIEAFEKNK